MLIKQIQLTKEQENYFNDLKQKLNPIYAFCLASRNVKTIEEAQYKYNLISTKKLKDIDNFSIHLSQAIEENKKISIVADYDCDGATSCSIAYLGLLIIGVKQENLNFIVPNRMKHGYGLSRLVIDDLIAEKGKPDLIITVDNGIAAHDGIEYANSLGINILVTDHHLPIKDKENPNCLALVNPNQVGDESGLNNMAGCGVIFYCLKNTASLRVAQGLLDKSKENELLRLLDLVSLGTIADVVKLDKNNRLLVNYGLNLVKQGRTRFGIDALFQISNKDIYYANSRDYGFSVAPRINAAGRLEDMTKGIQCLISKDWEEAKDLAKQLNDWNVQRKSLEKDMKDIAFDIIEIEQQSNNMSRIVFDESYHEGVIGIVASRLKEDFNCPSIVFSPTEHFEIIKGSGRSIPEVHLRDAIDWVYKQDPSIFVGFGGHSMAAGLSIYRNKLELFKELFEKSVIEVIGNEPLIKEIKYDLDLNPKDLNLELAFDLEKEIWGQGFIEPIFRSQLTIENIEHLTNRETQLPTHTKFMFNANDDLIEGLHFFNLHTFKIGETIDVFYRLTISRFRDEEKLSLMIIHIESQNKEALQNEKIIVNEVKSNSDSKLENKKIKFVIPNFKNINK